MGTCAVIDDATGIIVNRIVLDDPEAWEVPEGHSIVEETEPMDIGGTYVDGVYTPPVYPPPVPPLGVPGPDANARLDAGIEAALAVAEAVKAAMQNIPDNFSANNYTMAKIQLDALTQAMVSMLQAQAAPPAVPPP